MRRLLVAGGFFGLLVALWVYHLAVLIFREADDPARVRHLADLLASLTIDAVMPPHANDRPSADAVARCGRRAPD